MYDDKFIKTKITIYNNKIYTNFQHNKTSKDNEYCTCLSLDFILMQWKMKKQC